MLVSVTWCVRTDVCNNYELYVDYLVLFEPLDAAYIKRSSC